MVEGKLQIEGELIHVIVSKCYNMTKQLRYLTVTGDEKPVSPTLFDNSEGNQQHKVRDSTMIEQKVFSEGRNFR